MKPYLPLIFLFATLGCTFEQDIKCFSYNPELFEYLPYKVGEVVSFRNQELDSVLTLSVSGYSGEHVVAINDVGNDCYYEFCKDEIRLTYNVVDADLIWEFVFDPSPVAEVDSSDWHLYWDSSGSVTDVHGGTYSEDLRNEPTIASLVDSLNLSFSDVFAFSNYETVFDSEKELYYIQYNHAGCLFEKDLGLVLFKNDQGDIWIIDEPLSAKEFLIDNVQYNEYEKFCP